MIDVCYLHHGVNTENDWAEVLGCDANLDGLDDGEGEGHTPQDTTSRAENKLSIQQG